MKRISTIAVMLAALLLAASVPAAVIDYTVGSGPKSQVTLLSAATTGTSDVMAFGGTQATATCYIIWGTTAASGTIQPESAATSTFAGTWAPAGLPIAWTANNSQDMFQSLAPVWNLRFRFTANAAGTGVSVICSAK